MLLWIRNVRSSYHKRTDAFHCLDVRGGEISEETAIERVHFYCLPFLAAQNTLNCSGFHSKSSDHTFPIPNMEYFVFTIIIHCFLQIRYCYLFFNLCIFLCRLVSPLQNQSNIVC